MRKLLTQTILAALLLFLVVSVTAAQVSWTDGRRATFVIGQPDFTSKGSGTSEVTLWSPRDVAVDSAHQKLYVVDGFNNRVLRYSLPITDNQPTAERVFGQADMITNGAATSRSGLSTPGGLDVDATGRLWVADQGNNRVVWYNQAHEIAANGPDADGVLGQPDFTSGGAATSQCRMYSPTDLAVGSDDRLFVADSDNHRVLRFNDAAGKAPGANADGVLGQSDFLAALSVTSHNGMNTPRGVALDGTTLFVAELGNRRILRFEDAGIRANGAYADGVLGQSSFESNYSNISQSRMEAPSRITVDPSGALYVSDALTANRVLIFFDASLKANGDDADNVIGQENFTDFGTGATAQDNLNLDPNGSGIAFDPVTRILAVTDDKNHRVMIFQYWQVYLPMAAR